MNQTFIDPQRIESLLDGAREPDRQQVADVLDKARECKGLAPEDVAVLLNLEDEDCWEDVFELAREIKLRIYGRRIVLFAPIYVSDYCVNDCAYCGFRRSNRSITRKALELDELRDEVLALESVGHKRLLMVFGEHPHYGGDYMADAIRTVYETRTADGKGEIRRVNVNAAPMSVEEFARLKDCGIGTFQIFQETYHPGRYAELHPADTIKGDFAWRLYALHRAQEGGLDDVAIGALFGLYDWRFEVMGLLYHALDLEKHFNVGPHTVSFPRLEPALDTPFNRETPYLVSDNHFKRLVAIIRLMIPYTGMILTCRETPELRREVIRLGVSQIDGGTRIGVGGYGDRTGSDLPDRSQFTIFDTRSLDEIIGELAGAGFLPSFCTACYRSERTGEQFMDVAKHGHVKEICQSNALLTFLEYLEDYASDGTKNIGLNLLREELGQLDESRARMLERKMAEVRAGRRDIYF